MRMLVLNGSAAVSPHLNICERLLGVDVGLKKCQMKSLTLPQHRVWGLHVREQGTLVLRFQVQAVLVVSADCLL